MHIDVLGIRIHIWFFLTAFLLGWGAGTPARVIIWVLIVLFSVLLHEAGHAAAGRAFGLRSKIELTAFGGITRFSGGEMTPWQRVLVSLAGPGAGFVAGSLLVAAYVATTPYVDPESTVRFALQQALWVNIGWGVFNLLPVLPLDGGQVGLALLSRRDPEQGLIRMSAVSVVFAGGVAAMALLVFARGGLFVGVLFGLLAFSSFRTLMAARSVRRDRTGGLNEQLEQAQQLLASEPDEAMALAAQVRMSAQHASTKASATQIIAAVLLGRGDPDAALTELQSIQAPYQPDENLLRACSAGALDQAMADGRFEEAGRLAEQLFRGTGHPEVAFTAARAFARAGLEDEALAWLKKAASAGFAMTARYDEDADLAALRRRADWPRVRDELDRLRPPG